VGRNDRKAGSSHNSAVQSTSSDRRDRFRQVGPDEPCRGRSLVPGRSAKSRSLRAAERRGPKVVRDRRSAKLPVSPRGTPKPLPGRPFSAPPGPPAPFLKVRPGAVGRRTPAKLRRINAAKPSSPARPTNEPGRQVREPIRPSRRRRVTSQGRHTNGPCIRADPALFFFLFFLNDLGNSRLLFCSAVSGNVSLGPPP